MFAKNLDIINKHNEVELMEVGQNGLFMGVNQMADWTKDEYKAILGYKRAPLNVLEGDQEVVVEKRKLALWN